MNAHADGPENAGSFLEILQQPLVPRNEIGTPEEADRPRKDAMIADQDAGERPDGASPELYRHNRCDDADSRGLVRVIIPL